MHRLVEHGLVAPQAGAVVGGPDQELLRQELARPPRLPGQLELGHGADSEEGADIPMALDPRHQAGSPKLTREIDTGG